MNISKQTTVTTQMSVILTDDDIKELIRNKFNIDSTTAIVVSRENTGLKVSWSEYQNVYR